MENTALAGYWWKTAKGEKPLCSQCDPEIKKWHGVFERKSAIGMQIGEDGFLYSPGHIPHHTKIIGVVE
jgi:hypothetical protein